MNKGYDVDPELLGARIATLTKLGDLTGDLVATASRLAERLPMLGTAPPAVHLAMRLREAAGRSGLAGEVSAAEQEAQEFQRTLSEANAGYAAGEAGAESAMRATEATETPTGTPAETAPRTRSETPTEAAT